MTKDQTDPRHDGQADAGPSRYVTDRELAPILRVSVGFLQKDRITAQRIPFVRLGDRCLYDLQEALAAVKALTVGGMRGRRGQVYGSREVAMSDEIRRLAREAHTWSKAAESYAADAERFRWLAEHTVATGLARWVHPFQFLGEAVDARRNEATTNAAPRVTTAAELRQQAKSDTSCVGAFARARPGKA